MQKKQCRYISDNFRPCDVAFDYWTVSGAGDSKYRLINCDSFRYRNAPIKMKVVDKGYKALPDKTWQVGKTDGENFSDMK